MHIKTDNNLKMVTIRIFAFLSCCILALLKRSPLKKILAVKFKKNLLLASKETASLQCSGHLIWKVYIYYKGRRSRSGRPGDRRTNVLTEIASPTLCFQARSPRIVCTDPCPHQHHGPDVTESWGDVRTSRF